MSNYDVSIMLIPKGEGGEVHSTLCGCGPQETAPPYIVLDNVVRMLARYTMPPYGVVLRHAMFGMDNDTMVAVLDGPMLNSLYVSVMLWANQEWGYSPHISKQSGYELPPPGTTVEFDRISLWNNEKRFTYRFGSGTPCAS